jgi:TolA-binding protein
VEQAEQLYAEFNRKYPGAPVKALIDDQFARFYYRHQMWVKLLALTKPAIKDYIETRKLKSPFFLFLYSEAKLATGDPGEAEKGFKTVIKLFPGSSEAKISHSRLEGFQPKPGK